MNAPLFPLGNSFSKASVSETSPRTLSKTVGFSPNLSLDLFYYCYYYYYDYSRSFLLQRRPHRRRQKCLWIAWCRWLIQPLMAVASSRERVGTASRAAAAAADFVKKKKKKPSLSLRLTSDSSSSFCLFVCCACEWKETFWRKKRKKRDAKIINPSPSAKNAHIFVPSSGKLLGT